ncbi:MAG: amino acid ABC transporter substrate-binding protein [Deltaproteobacteria bacterium]|nr:amino acid ABC transporter substrate-binding protein [Deltaproteobacteria bacterium]MBW2017514.1 amino acid ABC transporter substrate-binding protein [Deltaproteobacteria bacterium]MBW2130241.1 amino acid ABC transporter substrate-binding protein [Deltaproteobacteria bacterium]MBW2304782.1 amino acid ABC transporter substrate-binding protein [Deltaproteobacteria bacterium]
MKSKSFVFFVVLTVFAFSLSIGQAFAKDVIKIGLTISTTGKYTFASSQGFKGISIWADLINEQGGLMLNGKKVPVKLIYYDDRSDKETVAKLYEKLINQDKVDVCFAPFGSTLTGAAAAITEKYGKMLVIWSAASDAIYAQGYKNIVSATETPVSLMPKPEIDHMASLGIKKMAIVYVDEPFPAGLAKYAKSLAEAKGIKVTMSEKFSPGTKDFSILLQKVRMTKPDAFYASAYMDDQKIMIRQMKEANLMFPYVYMVYSGMPQWADLKEDGLYIFGHTLYHKTLNWKVNAGLSREDFEKVFNKKFPKAENPPDFQTSLSYGAGVLLGKFIEKANSLSGPALKKAALELSKKVTVMTGPYEIDESGKQLQMPFIVTQIQKENGKQKMVLVYPEAVATAKPIYPIPGWNDR